MKNKKWLVIGLGSVMVIALGIVAFRTIKKNKEQKELEAKGK